MSAHDAQVPCPCLALDRGEFDADVQPFVHVPTGVVIGAELLARWHHPDGTVRTPNQFIDHLDEAGRLSELTDHMLSLSGLLMLGGRMVSVNLASEDVADPSLVTRVEQALAPLEGDPTRLCLEVVESDMGPDAVDRLAALNARGIQIAVDDFGAAYSSIARVIDLEVDIVKLDRSLVTQIHERPRSEVLVRSLIAGMQELGTVVIAEGIETREELERIVELGCDVVQGWACGRPRPIGEVVDLFAHTDPLDRARWPD